MSDGDLSLKIPVLVEGDFFKNKPPFAPWDGDYDKKHYDVVLHTGELVYLCWPNAGKMMEVEYGVPGVDGGRVFEPAEVRYVRVSPVHPMDPEFVHPLLCAPR
jgi:hypothetical protein